MLTVAPSPSPDFHPDQFYKAHSSTEEDKACHRGKGIAGVYGAETSDCDSPFSLVNATFDWIEQNIRDDIDFVVWTGDSARHDSDEKHPRNADEVLSTNRIISDKFVETFSSGKNAVPVIPTFGNNDFLPHNIFYPGPNKWLKAYADIWRTFIPEEQRHSFEFGGWFWVEVVPNHLAVFSLNTMYFFDRNAGVDGCADPNQPGFAHMEWLRVQLQLLRERGMKAILIGHVPPARTDSKQNWDETCWQKYSLWLKQYRDVVTGSLYGHMNIDHFLLVDTKEVDIAADANEFGTRESIGEDISIESKQDYLHELRESWSDLPGSVIKAMADEDDDMGVEKKHKKKKHKKNKKNKKIGGKYAERYHLSLVSPSIVPNYFPTMRVIEYNITGLEDTAVWADSIDTVEPLVSVTDVSEKEEIDESWYQELKRDLEAEGKKKKKKKKGKKPKKPTDPNLVVPEDPPTGSTPGPAYYPQPFTFTGYTQYYANLTHINNDLTSDVEGSKWRDGDYTDEDPKHKKPKPLDFNFEVEYSTFDDKVYKLKDMTVMSYLKLAYKMGEKSKGKGKGKALDTWDDDFTDDEMVGPVLFDNDLDDLDSEDTSDDIDVDSDSDDLEDSDPEDAESQGKKKKKKKHKKHHKNKTWLRFLDRAFVGSVSREELEKM